MKKTKRNSKVTQNQNDEKFARKVMGQIIACTLIFVTVFANSRLSNELSCQINDKIKHYLCVSVDFDKAINTAKTYIEKFMSNGEAVQVNTSDDTVSDDDNR